MKIVIQNSATVWGGNEKWMAMLAAGLLRRGHQVIVSCRAGSAIEQELRRRGIPTSTVRPGSYLDVLRGVSFVRWLRAERPDALLLTSWKTTPWGAFAGKAASVPRVVVRLGIVRVPRHLRHSFAFRRWIDAIIVNSAEIRTVWARDARWFDADRIHVILNGIVPPDPHPRDQLRRLRETITGESGSILIAAAGHLTHRKGVDLLLHAVKGLADPRVRIVVVGSGPEEERLRELAAVLGISEQVSWLGHRSDVPDIVAACDIFVLPSRNEGMANVMLEAMAAGTLVVATDISGVREAIGSAGQEGPAGWIVPPEDPEALMGALRKVVADLRGARREVERRTAAASERIRTRFSPERMVGEVEDVLGGRL